jgi:hypothetical protein
MAFINIPSKSSNDTLSPDEFNYLINKINSLKLSLLQGSGFEGTLSISDVPSIDGWYFASESGTYTNAGNLVVDISGNLSIITVSNSVTTFSLLETPIPQGLESEVVKNSVKAIESHGVWTALYGTGGLSEEISSIKEDTLTNTSNISSLLSGLSNQGQWNALTNTPDIGASPLANQYWIVQETGTTLLGSESSWTIGDWALYTDNGWTRIDAATYMDVLKIETDDSFYFDGAVLRPNISEYRQTIEYSGGSQFFTLAFEPTLFHNIIVFYNGVSRVLRTSEYTYTTPGTLEVLISLDAGSEISVIYDHFVIQPV